MNNLTVIKYEIQKLVFTKKYFYMILVLAVWTTDVLLRLVINGFYSTAPFSKWSYSEFMTLVCPIFSIIIILLCAEIFSEKEKNVTKIIFAAPLSKAKYYIIKEVSVFTVVIMTALLPVLLSFIYYIYIFGYSEFQNFIVPVFLFAAAQIIFIFGLAVFTGKINRKLLYVLAPVIFALGSINLSDISVFADIFGNDFLQTYGIQYIYSCTGSQIDFIIPQNFIISRIIFVGFGIFFIVMSWMYKNK